MQGGSKDQSGSLVKGAAGHQEARRGSQQETEVQITQRCQTAPATLELLFEGVPWPQCGVVGDADCGCWEGRGPAAAPSWQSDLRHEAGERSAASRG